jgi:hypothetical protein
MRGFTGPFDHIFETEGVGGVHARDPGTEGERVRGTLRAEPSVPRCLNHMLIYGRRHLQEMQGQSEMVAQPERRKPKTNLLLEWYAAWAK